MSSNGNVIFQSGDKLIVIDDVPNNVFENMPFKIGDIVTCLSTLTTSNGTLKINIKEYPDYKFFGYRFKKHDVPKWKKEYKGGYG